MKRVLGHNYAEVTGKGSHLNSRSHELPKPLSGGPRATRHSRHWRSRCDPHLVTDQATQAATSLRGPKAKWGEAWDVAAGAAGQTPEQVERKIGRADAWDPLRATAQQVPGCARRFGRYLPLGRKSPTGATPPGRQPRRAAQRTQRFAHDLPAVSLALRSNASGPWGKSGRNWEGSEEGQEDTNARKTPLRARRCLEGGACASLALGARREPRKRSTETNNAAAG
ncbi:hypothetical protein TREES_T100015913 [Tupaia chinensis]|uniref:Uncharacterized protein n=1 Tax=Tupaia chinensis TaxID=246437 RepID=L9KWC1_TUPCH|nr:hypothetical protein TREES_T100015913 [Tupaia chinensis]